MKKLMQKTVILIIICTMLLTQQIAMLSSLSAQTNLTNRYFYGVSTTGLYPTESLLSPWGWTGVTYNSLPEGGTNISYNNFGDSNYCVGINKTVKLDGMDLLLNLDTTKAVSANDQYFYISFCNGLQQSFWTNPFAIRINRTIGQVVLYCNGGIIAVLDNRPEIKNTTSIRVKTDKINGVYNVAVNGLNFGVTVAQLTSCNNFNDLDKTYVTISPAVNNTKFSMDILYLRGGEGVDCDYIMGNVPAEQVNITSAANAIDLINAIGLVTSDSESAIIAARNKYESLGSYNGASYKTMVFNLDKLISAENEYMAIVAAQHPDIAVIQMIDNLGTITVNSGPAIIAAESAYSALDPVQKSLVTNYQKLLDARSEYNVLISITDLFYYGIDSSELFPTNSIKDSWGNWTGITYTDIESGGVNVSYTNFGSPDYCIGINKAVKFDGLHLELQINTAKATTENDQYFYMNFCNGLQQSISTNPFSIRINRKAGQVVLYAGGNITAVLDSRPEIINSTKVTVIIKLNQGGTDYNVAVNGLNFTLTASQIADCTNFGNQDATYVSLSPVLGGTNCSIDILSLHGGEMPCIDFASTDDKLLVKNVDVTMHLISAIGTVTSNSGSKITEARTMFDSLKEFQKLVNNADVLLTAENSYNKIIVNIQKAALVIQVIENLGEITKNSGNKIIYAENSYMDLLPRQRRLVSNYQILVNARAKYDLLVPYVETPDNTSPNTGEVQFNITAGLLMAICTSVIISANSKNKRNKKIKKTGGIV